MSAFISPDASPPSSDAKGAAKDADCPVPAPTAVLGAGPAGLTAAYVLAGAGRAVTVLEKDDQVGGLARTVEYKGFRFDIGGHRFFTKVSPVRDLWRAMLGDDLLRRPRLSRIYYAGRFFDYPLKPMNALRGLGLVNASLLAFSYLWSQLRPIAPEVSFEDWVSNRFGRRLYRTFFKTYTEKVWGIPCNAIGAQWAAQRIKGLSMRTAVTDMLLRPLRGSQQTAIKTLIGEFEYPRLGPGMMWDAFRQQVTNRGGTVLTGTDVRTLHHRDNAIDAVEYVRDGTATRVPVEAVLSTLPLRHLVASLSPPAPQYVRAAADQLHYRDFLTVALIVDKADMFPDNWIYVHDPGVKLGRIQNFKNWSVDLVPDQTKTCLGLEYFCFEGDQLWSMSDADLVALGRTELARIGLVDPALVIDGAVVRMPKAYPVYDTGYESALDVVRDYLRTFSNLQVAGRNGMHRYNNQDHSMVTGMLAARALMGHEADTWTINAGDEYHETGEIDLGTDLRDLLGTQPLVPLALQPRRDDAPIVSPAPERLAG